MRLIFVRHGHPNYQEDCLTPLGHLQAEAAADRLRNEPIAAVYASSRGRAVETAEHIAARFGMPVIQLDFMREIRWGSIDEEPLEHRGHPWFTVDDMVLSGQDLWSSQWETEDPFRRNKVLTDIRMIREQLDLWMQTLGYVREGKYYRVCGGGDQTYLLVSHGGSSNVVLAHLMNLPFPLACKLIRPDCTAITVLYFRHEEGALTCPEIELMNDARHIDGLESPEFFGN